MIKREDTGGEGNVKFAKCALVEIVWLCCGGKEKLSGLGMLRFFIPEVYMARARGGSLENPENKSPRGEFNCGRWKSGAEQW